MATSGRYRHQVKFYLVKKYWQPLNRWCHGRQNAVQPLDVSLHESDADQIK
jgi:hypothetical protein